MQMFQGEFERFGMVTDVYNSGKGYAFVTFENAEDGQNAIKVSSAGSCSPAGISCMLYY